MKSLSPTSPLHADDALLSSGLDFLQEIHREQTCTKAQKAARKAEQDAILEEALKIVYEGW
jgi:hypothetical protein